MALDLSAFQSAHASLRAAIERSRQYPEDEFVRDAVIQRFEYTYELAWKSLRRYLEEEGVQEVEAFSKKDLFREAAIRKLIGNPEIWFSHHKARNETSHTYNRAKAEEVHKTAIAFSEDAGKLLETLRGRTQ